MIYSSKQNTLIKKIASLKDKKYRKEYNLYVSEGIKPVNDAIRFGMPIEYIVATSSVISKILPTNSQVIEVTDDVFSFISDEKTPQGALCVIKVPNVDKIERPKNNAVILDGVQDPGNMGTIIRSALAFGYTDLYLVNCVDCYAPKVVRSSMSSIYKVNLYKGSLDQVLSVLDGYEIIACDMAGKDLKTFIPSKKHVICVGNEGNGISNELLGKSSSVVAIKMNEYSESLNVSVALSIVMYQLSK